MPEGDTIHTLAATLRGEIVGRRLGRVLVNGQKARSLQTEIVMASAIGKHLLIGFDTGDVIRTHLGMHGRFRLVPSWKEKSNQPRSSRKSRRDGPLGFVDVTRPSLILEHRDRLIVGHQLKELEILPARDLRRHPALSRLGPDLIVRPVVLRKVLDRAQQSSHPARLLVDLLLDQKVAAGIGNVYKNELLFLHRLSPATTCGQIDRRTLASIYRRAARLLRINLERQRKTTPWPDTRSGLPRVFVYGRSGDGCLVCGTAIRSQRLGFGQRSTYWCPRCQR